MEYKFKMYTLIIYYLLIPKIKGVAVNYPKLLRLSFIIFIVFLDNLILLLNFETYIPIGIVIDTITF